jgi:catabolite regulation protein CreA
MKFLSHHPNHFNRNVRLNSGEEIDPLKRSKKIYADKNGLHFKKITLKRLLDKKPEKFTDKEYLANVLRFDLL